MTSLPHHRVERRLSNESLLEVQHVVKTIEVELASFVPDDVTIRVEEKAGGSISDCAPGGVSWGSSTVVRVTEQPDLGNVVDAVEDEWARADEFEIDLSETPKGEQRLVLRSAELGNYHFRRFDDAVQVLSFSTCFAYDEERDGYAWEIFAE